MKSNEFINESLDRVATGVRNTTIPIPSKTYSGPVDRYTFNNVQEKNYQALKAILNRNGKDFTHIGVEDIIGYPAYNATYTKFLKSDPTVKIRNSYQVNALIKQGVITDYTPEDWADIRVRLTSFVATAPGFVWQKYEGTTAGGGQNVVYAGGQKIKLTSFLKLTSEEQDALINT